jgi:hypothetical protein
MEGRTIYITKHKSKLFNLLENETVNQPKQTFDNAGAHFDYGELYTKLTAIQRERGQTPDTTSSSKVGQRSSSREVQNAAEIISPTHIRRRSDVVKSNDLFNKIIIPHHKKTTSINANRMPILFDNLISKKTPLHIGCNSRKSANKKPNALDIINAKAPHITPKICICNKDFNFKSLDYRKRIEPMPSSNNKAYKKITDLITPRKLLSKMDYIRRLKQSNEMSSKNIP